MANLSKISTADLEAELQRRATAKEAFKPLSFDAERLKKFVETVDSIIQNNIERARQDEDDEHYVYEAAIQAVYGDDAFDRLRKLF